MYSSLNSVVLGLLALMESKNNIADTIEDISNTIEELELSELHSSVFKSQKLLINS